MTSSSSPSSTKTTRRLTHLLGLATIAFMLLTTLALTPSADAQQLDLRSRFDIVTNDCIDRYVPSVDENGNTICWEANPYGDGVYGDQGAFGCDISVNGRTVYREVDDGYSVDHFPYIEVLYGCYYYPGVTFVPNYAPTVYWTAPSNSFPTSWNFGF